MTTKELEDKVMAGVPFFVHTEKFTKRYSRTAFNRCGGDGEQEKLTFNSYTKLYTEWHIVEMGNEENSFVVSAALAKKCKGINLGIYWWDGSGRPLEDEFRGFKRYKLEYKSPFPQNIVCPNTGRLLQKKQKENWLMPYAVKNKADVWVPAMCNEDKDVLKFYDKDFLVCKEMMIPEGLERKLISGTEFYTMGKNMGLWK